MPADPQTTLLPFWLAVVLALIAAAGLAVSGYLYCLAQHATGLRPALGYALGAAAVLGLGLGGLAILVIVPRVEAMSHGR